MIINPDTIFCGHSISIGVIVPDSNTNNNIVDALNAIHIPITKYYLNKLDYKKLYNQNTLILNSNTVNVNNLKTSSLDSIRTFIVKGGKLIFIATNNRIPANFLPDSIGLVNYYKQNLQPNDQLDIKNNQDSLWNYPNKITTEDFQKWKETLSNTKSIYRNDSASKSYLNYKNITTQENENGLLMEYKYGQGSVLIVGLAIEDQLNIGISSAYKLLVNMLY